MKRLGEMAFTEVGPLAASGEALVILPVGVVEEHGAHLPLGLDSFAAEVYAGSAAPHLEEAGYESAFRVHSRGPKGSGKCLLSEAAQALNLRP